MADTTSPPTSSGTASSGAPPFGASSRRSAGRSSLPDTAQELLDLIKAYAKQETVDPLKAVGRWLGWGLAGSLLLGIGVIMLVLALLRGMQASWDDFFMRNYAWSWVPYVVTLVVSLIVVSGCAKVISVRRSRL